APGRTKKLPGRSPRPSRKVDPRAGSASGDAGVVPCGAGEHPLEVRSRLAALFLTEGGRMDAPDEKSLPENAYQPLAPGESYAPIVPASSSPPEVTVRSVTWGLLLCVLFTVASA